MMEVLWGDDKGGQRPQETRRLICQFGEHTSLDRLPSLPRVEHIYPSGFTMRLPTCINDPLFPTLLKMYIIIVVQDLSFEANFEEVSHEYREMRITFHRHCEYCFKVYWRFRAGKRDERSWVSVPWWCSVYWRNRWRESSAVVVPPRDPRLVLSKTLRMRYDQVGVRGLCQGLLLLLLLLPTRPGVTRERSQQRR